MAECGSCHLTVSKVAELRQKDKLILEPGSVAMAQAKQLAVLGYSGCGNLNATSTFHSPDCSIPVMDNNPTLPLPGSITKGVPEPEAVCFLA